ncbi:hypothetical protein E2562_036229 [Oryza meyeriana var. granulata]|uniref:Uncharacterized protein n=1 Tax=Oryza meyeriana var. granulata TaxID=110450 RepID=A0A6G1ET86_9ORYZ|nr:hypothetical protein E2562_036229 [Oryza meyeriana var. granulata]
MVRKVEEAAVTRSTRIGCEHGGCEGAGTVAMCGRVAQGWRPWRLPGWRRKTTPTGGPRPHLSVAPAVTGAGGGGHHAGPSWRGCAIGEDGPVGKAERGGGRGAGGGSGPGCLGWARKEAGPKEEEGR